MKSDEIIDDNNVFVECRKISKLNNKPSKMCEKYAGIVYTLDGRCECTVCELFLEPFESLVKRHADTIGHKNKMKDEHGLSTLDFLRDFFEMMVQCEYISLLIF